MSRLSFWPDLRDSLIKSTENLEQVIYLVLILEVFNSVKKFGHQTTLISMKRTHVPSSNKCFSSYNRRIFNLNAETKRGYNLHMQAINKIINKLILAMTLLSIPVQTRKMERIPKSPCKTVGLISFFNQIKPKMGWFT